MAYQLTKLTPNLIVADVGRSLAFYRDVLGFERTHIVPDEPPYVFAGVVSGTIEIFLNARDLAVAEYPAFRDTAIGGTFTMFIEVVGIDQVYASLKDRVEVVMPIEKKWYGVTEFAFKDPDGYLITFAERH